MASESGSAEFNDDTTTLSEVTNTVPCAGMVTGCNDVATTATTVFQGFQIK